MTLPLKIEIARARGEHAEQLSAIARRSKAHWGYSAEQLASWRAELTLAPEFIEAHHVLIARVGGRLAGLCAVVPHGRRVVVEHFWVDPPWIGHGVGRELFARARKRAAQLGGLVLEIDSDPNATAFYEKMGAQVVGQVAAPLPGDPQRYLPRMELELR